jgi:hypothetical protein
MNNFKNDSSQLADIISGHLNGFFTSVSDITGFLTAVGTVACAAAVIACSALPAEILATARRWHGSVDKQYGWPPGAKTALHVILPADDNTEIIRRQTTYLYNDIRMTDGSPTKKNKNKENENRCISCGESIR